MNIYYDIHCHIFNRNVIIRKLFNVVQSVLVIKDLLDKEIPAEDLRYKIEGITRTLQEVSEDTSEKVYNALNKVYNDQVAVTPLMFDLTFADDNDQDESKNKRYRKRIKRIIWLLTLLMPIVKSKAKKKFKNEELQKAIDNIQVAVKEFHKSLEKKSAKEMELFDNGNFEQQVAELEYLAGKNKNVRPFFSVDPRREYTGKANMIELLKEKLLGENAKFAGVKLYTPAGFSPTDPVLMGTPNQKGVYEFCMENKIPITVHNSNAGFACFSKFLRVRGHVYHNNIVTPINQVVKFHHDFFGLKAAEAIKERARYLNHPKLWQLVLQKYPTLTINFAHFGGGGEIMDYINYKIVDTKIETVIFEDRIQHLMDEQKVALRNGFQKKGRFMLLKENLTISERAKIWNIIYAAEISDNWSKAIFDLIKNPAYPNAYTDLSCFSVGALIKSPDNDQLFFSIKENLKNFKISFFDKLNDYEKSKILYGSDYFLTQFFGPTMKQYFDDFREAFGKEFDLIAKANPERFLNIKMN
jgi:predicted TIM-barrel fold metal-dependent hydrolase